MSVTKSQKFGLNLRTLLITDWPSRRFSRISLNHRSCTPQPKRPKGFSAHFHTTVYYRILKTQPWCFYVYDQDDLISDKPQSFPLFIDCLHIHQRINPHKWEKPYTLHIFSLNTPPLLIMSWQNNLFLWFSFLLYTLSVIYFSLPSGCPSAVSVFLCFCFYLSIYFSFVSFRMLIILFTLFSFKTFRIVRPQLISREKSKEHTGSSASRKQ